MAAKRWFDRGTTTGFPLETSFKPEGQSREFRDLVYRSNTRVVADRLEDFDGEPLITELWRPFINTASNVDLVQIGGTSGVSRAYFRVPRAGIITDVGFLAEDGFTQNGSVYITLTGLNLQVAGDGNRALLDTTAHVNTTDSNAAALNGGTDLVAKVFYSCALTATTASLYVKEGDVIEITSTSTSTAAKMDAAQCSLKIRSLPLGLKPTVTHTGGATTNVPLAIQSLNASYGEALLQLSATNEAQTVRLDLADQLVIPAGRAGIFSCRVKVSGAAANTRMVWGLCTAYNATLNSTTENAWFRLEGNSLLVKAETDDNTTDNDLQSTGFTMTADTYAMFTIDLTDPAHVKFKINDDVALTLAASAFSTSMLLQPFIAIQKDSGTGAQSLTVDWVRWLTVRF